MGRSEGGGSREGYIKAVCLPVAFLSFSPYRLCPSIATEAVFGFLHVALFSRSFCFFSLATSKEGKRRSMVHYSLSLLWLGCFSGCVRFSTKHFLPSKVHRVHECLRFAVGESFRQQQLFRLYSACSEAERATCFAVFLINRVNIYNNLCALRQSRSLTYLIEVHLRRY